MIGVLGAFIGGFLGVAIGRYVVGPALDWWTEYRRHKKGIR